MKLTRKKKQIHPIRLEAMRTKGWMKHVMRLKPERVVIGEVKNGEVRGVLEKMNVGQARFVNA